MPPANWRRQSARRASKQASGCGGAQHNHIVRLPDRFAPAPAPPLRRVARIVVAGLGCALVVFLGGRLAERAVLGGNDVEARARVEADVRASFDTMSRALSLMARGMADPDSVVQATGGNATAARRLFAAADAALTQSDEDAEFAVTAYSAEGRPLAWSGRPSELPNDRLQGDEAWFFARGALGLRLSRIENTLSWFSLAALEPPLRSTGYV